MRKLYIILLFFFVSLNGFSQNAWSVYEWKVKPENVSTVAKICDDYLSQDGNVTEGTTVALYEVMFGGKGFEATHTLNIYGDMKA